MVNYEEKLIKESATNFIGFLWKLKDQNETLKNNRNVKIIIGFPEIFLIQISRVPAA